MFWQQIHQIDQQITLAINSCHSNMSDPIWAFFSDKLVWIPMYMGIIALLIWKLGWKRGLVAVAALALTFGFCDQFSNLIKGAVGRIRPVNDEFMISSGLHVLERGGGYSFFSAHAANALGLAFCSFTALKSYTPEGTDGQTPWWIKAYGVWIFFWGAMVGISRIFVGKHYLGDVIVGFMVGALAGIVFGSIARAVIRRIPTDSSRSYTR